MRNALFYQKLGKLLYAVAAADEKVTPQERIALNNEIRERLLHKERDTDGYGTNEAWLTDFSFETAEDLLLAPSESFQEFLDFAKLYKNELSEDEIEICLRLSDHMANAYHQINKKENKILSQLRNFLQSVNASKLIF